jgi:hypothetical protein
MNLRTMTTIVAAAGLGVGIPATPEAATKRCRSVKDVGPTGADPADGNRIRATRVSCGTARRVVKSYVRWVAQDDDGQPPISHDPWTCYPHGKRVLATVCKASGGRRVRWVLGR